LRLQLFSPALVELGFNYGFGRGTGAARTSDLLALVGLDS
jgi:hypothetical protein